MKTATAKAILTELKQKIQEEKQLLKLISKKHINDRSGKLKVNDILCSSSGYGQTNINYYKIKKLVGKTMVEVVNIESTLVDKDEYEDAVFPNPFVEGRARYRRKVYTDASLGIMICSFEYAALWNGKSQFQTNALRGH
tara:strand:- start:381 stop:797 length:417 start_codon:yes stop_codon:yes gene_type:complete